MKILNCNNLSKSYGKKTALKDINLSLDSGKIIGLLGPNGSGKTTLIKLFNGLLTPTSGELSIDNKQIGIETKKIVSYLSDSFSLPIYMKITEIVNCFSEFFIDFDPDKALSMIADLGLNKNDKLKHLSKGNKEKVQLILTMSRNASVYFLDEPLSGVDPATRDYILNTIISNYNENSLVIISTHLISDIEKVLDDVIFLKEGEIVLSDSVDNIREKYNKSVDELFREVFKC